MTTMKKKTAGSPCDGVPGASTAMLRGLCSKQPSALGLPIQHPFQAGDPEQSGLQGQYAQTHNVTVTRFHHYLLLHHLRQRSGQLHTLIHWVPHTSGNVSVCSSVCLSVSRVIA